MDNKSSIPNSNVFYIILLYSVQNGYNIQCNEIWYNAIEYHTLISIYIIKIYLTTVLYFVYTYTYIANKFKYCW